MAEGFIKLYRSYLDSAWYKDANTSRLFLHCLLKMNWKAGNFKGVRIEPGSFVTSIPRLSEELGMSEHQVRTALEHLKETGDVSVETTNRFSIVTVRSHCSFQDGGRQNDSLPADRRQTDGRQTAGIEIRRNESKKARRGSPFHEFSCRPDTDFNSIQNQIIRRGFEDGKRDEIEEDEEE